MLVLSRKAQQTIQIGDDVVITVVRVHGGHVRIGIEAPREVRVRRGELPPREAATTASTENSSTHVVSGTIAAGDDGRPAAPLGRYLKELTTRGIPPVDLLPELTVSRPLVVAEAAL